ncbi:MAG TPA: hypothetical protein VGR91_09095 [Stellaceae bacterium]|nr:hypothetical protein [Stellaceae bacterium]
MLADVDGVVRRIADWIGVALPPGGNIDVVTTNRLSSERNEDYCSRFVHDESALCEEWSRNREKQGRTQCRRRFEDARQRLRQESQFVAPE